jgi:hypothetical protein
MAVGGRGPEAMHEPACAGMMVAPAALAARRNPVPTIASPETTPEPPPTPTDTPPLPPTPETPAGVPPPIRDPDGPHDPTPVREPPGGEPPVVAAG